MRGSGGGSEGDGARRAVVTMVSRIYSPEASAASLRLSSLEAALLERGHDVRVLTSLPPSGSEEAPNTGGRISRWPVIRDRSGYVRGYVPYMSFDLPMILRVVFGVRSDVYVCEPPPTTGAALRLAAGLLRRPYVYYAADIWSDASAATTAPSFVVRVVRALESFALRGAAEVLAVTESVASRVREMAPGANVSVVGHGVDLDRFSPDGGAVDEPAHVVYVGSASEWHGAEIAVEALAEVMREDPELTAAFVGQGSSWAAMQSRVRELGLERRIRFEATVPPEVAASWLRGATVSIATLVPGQGYDFAVPTKLYASVAVGTPVVYAGPDPVRSMVQAEGLGAASEYDASALAAALREVLSAEEDGRDRLVAWARANVASQVVAQRSVVGIEKALRRGGRRARRAPGEPGRSEGNGSMRTVQSTSAARSRPRAIDGRSPRDR